MNEDDTIIEDTTATSELTFQDLREEIQEMESQLENLNTYQTTYQEESQEQYVFYGLVVGSLFAIMGMLGIYMLLNHLGD